MKELKIALINTTAGKRYLITTTSKSKQFKTLAGAERYAKNNGYKIIERLNLTK